MILSPINMTTSCFILRRIWPRELLWIKLSSRSESIHVVAISVEPLLPFLLSLGPDCGEFGYVG